MRIDGHTQLIAHIGFPTHSFKSPLIYNPYFAQAGIRALVTPMSCTAEHFQDFLPSVFKLNNLLGALITMPHKVSVMALLDDISPRAQVAGACNAVKRLADGRLHGDMFDGEGFVRGVQRKGLCLAGKRCLVVGAGGVGSAIAASLAQAQVDSLSLFDVKEASCQALAQRIRQVFPGVRVELGSDDPQGYDLVVNATPLGMKPDDPLPFNASKLAPGTWVGEVVLSPTITPLLTAAQSIGCPTLLGEDMLYEQIPAYLEFFDLPTTSAENLRVVSLA
jgi:shikimate dehydrogenase